MEIVEFKDYPNTETPLNSHNLNRMQNNIKTELTNIEQEGIIVSPTEPTENRRKVWMQKGKNLFSIGFISGYTLNSTTGNNESSSNYIVTNNFIEVKANTTYTISINSNLEMLERGPRICEYDENYNMINCLYNTGLTYTFTTSNHTKYIKFSEAFYSVDNMTTNIQVMLEQSLVATNYEEYIEPKTYILNDNNVYEEFMKKEEKTILYNNPNGSNGNITLLDDAENYDYLEIFFVDNNKHDYSSLKFVPNGENVVLSLQSGYTDSAGLHYTSRFSTFNVKGKSVTSDDTRNGFTNITNNLNIKEIRSGNFIYITKIVGYKN